MGAALAAEPGLGEDQIAAVKVLAGEGGSLRAVLAPAGYGKTTMLHTAAQAAAADGRPVLAVATTAKAVAELAGAGLDARTIARLRIDLANGPLAAGTVVVLDEISQTPTQEVEAVLAAVDACPGGSVWVLGDPRQSQPVGAGGMADHIERLANEGLVPSTRLTVNRRQVDPADREALGLLRQGDAAALPSAAHRARLGARAGQAVRDPTTPWQMPYATTSAATGPSRSPSLSCPTPTPRTWPTASAPGWRLLAPLSRPGPGRPGVDSRAGVPGRRPGPPARPLRLPRVRRWSTAPPRTVTAVDDDGLAVRLDGSGEAAALPAAFVQGTRKDGSPNLSHAWARTVDGAQGGTWEACHLLGSAALDAYRGYTGQSRSRQPTHTWNTARVAVVDHGGALADQRDAAEQVAEALARQPDPIPGGTQRPLGTRPPAPRTDRRARKGAGRPAPGPPTSSRRSDQGPPGRRELSGGHGGDRLPHGRPAGGDGRARRVDPTGQRAAPLVAGQVGLRRRTCRRCQGQAQTSWPAVPPVCAESKTFLSGSRRPRDGAGTTSHASGASWTTTGPRSSPPACKQTTLSPTGSTSSATLAPPRPGTCGTSTPGSRSTGPPNATTPVGSWPMP